MKKKADRDEHSTHEGIWRMDKLRMCAAVVDGCGNLHNEARSLVELAHVDRGQA